MLAVHDKGTKFRLEDWSPFESSLDDVISPPFFIMSDQFERQNVLVFAMGHLRRALLDSRVGWVLRSLYRSKERALPAEEIISLNSQEFPQHTKLPDNFLEKFKDLPEVPMKNMLRQLNWKDIYNLQLVAGPFRAYVENGRRNYPMNNLIQGIVSLDGTESVTVVRFHNARLTINHEQFSRSLRSVHLRTLLIRQKGTLRAASFHIPELKCSKLELRFSDPVDEDPEAENELAQILEQVIVNPFITSLSLIARRKENPQELSNRLNEIVRGARHLNAETTRISIVPP